MGTDQDENTRNKNDTLKFEDYQNMDSRDKDLAVEKSIIRLQQRIREMLYLVEPGIKPAEHKPTEQPDRAVQTAKQDSKPAND